MWTQIIAFLCIAHMLVSDKAIPDALGLQPMEVNRPHYFCLIVATNENRVSRKITQSNAPWHVTRKPPCQDRW